MSYQGYPTNDHDEYYKQMKLSRDPETSNLPISTRSSVESNSYMNTSGHPENSLRQSDRTSNDTSLPRYSNQSLGYNNLETPSKMRDVDDFNMVSNSRSLLTPGPVFDEPNTWINATVKRSDRNNNSQQVSDINTSSLLNRNLDISSFHDSSSLDANAAEYPVPSSIPVDRARIGSPVDKIRDSPDFLSLVSQIWHSSKPNESLQRSSSPPPQPSGWNQNASAGHEYPTIQYSKYEPVVTGSGSPHRRPEYASRSADQAISNPTHNQQSLFRSYGNVQVSQPVNDNNQHHMYNQSSYLQSSSNNSYSMTSSGSISTSERRPSYLDDNNNDPLYPAYNIQSQMIYEAPTSYPASRRGSENVDTLSNAMLSLPIRSDIEPSYPYSQPSNHDHSISSQPASDHINSNSNSSAWSSISSIAVPALSSSSIPYPQDYHRMARYSHDSIDMNEYKPGYHHNNSQYHMNTRGDDMISSNIRSSSSEFPSARTSFDNDHHPIIPSHQQPYQHLPSSQPLPQPPLAYQQPPFIQRSAPYGMHEHESMLQPRHSHDDYQSYRQGRQQYHHNQQHQQQPLYPSSSSSMRLSGDDILSSNMNSSLNQPTPNLPLHRVPSYVNPGYVDDVHTQQQYLNSAFTSMQINNSNNNSHHNHSNSNNNVAGMNNATVNNNHNHGNNNANMKRINSNGNSNSNQNYVNVSQSISQAFLHPPSGPPASIDQPKPIRRTTPTGPHLSRSTPSSSVPTPPSNNSPSANKHHDSSISSTSTSSSLSRVNSKQHHTSNSQDSKIMSTSPNTSLTMSLIRPSQTSASSFSSDLVESPRTKHLYKEFYRVFRMKERESLEAAKAYVMEALAWIPEKSKWKIYLELAEISKRNNDFDEARMLYEKVTTLQPLASQGWLEWSKMEEEFGCFERSLIILQDGLQYCQYNEGLFTKAVKQHERRDENQKARQMLSGLLYESVDRVWRSILEGALFEVRSGETNAARKLFKFLMQHVSWYGPIYYEAYRLDEKEADYEHALKIIYKGLTELPRYGPLWFGLLRIMERYDVTKEQHAWLLGNKPKLDHIRHEVVKAVKNISPELIWKLYFEQAQAEERAADCAAHGLYTCISSYASSSSSISSYSLSSARHKYYHHARISLIKSLLVCPYNLKWKVWLAGCRLELGAGRLSAARQALCLAFHYVPIKSKAYVYLESCRLEEYSGNIQAARRLLCIAKQEIANEWKLHLEAVLLEARAGDLHHAAYMAEESLKQHSGTGRLWAVLIQLCHRLETITSKKHHHMISSSSSSSEVDHQDSNIRTPNRSHVHADYDSDEEIHGIMVSSSATQPSSSTTSSYKLPNKFHIFSQAVLQVPKSGEVWCEGARCVMNPMSITTFDLSLAQRYISYAIMFTPQYGDAFIEYIRWEMLAQVLLPRILAILGLNQQRFYLLFLSYDTEADILDFASTSSYDQIDNEADASYTTFRQQYCRTLITAFEMMNDDDIHENILPPASELLQQYRDINIKKLNRRCSNADPNYGTLWFHSRIYAYDASHEVLHHAIYHISHELIGCSLIYARAIMHYIEKCIRQHVMTMLQTDDMKSQVDAWLSHPPPPQATSSHDHHHAGEQKIIISDEEMIFHQYTSFLKDYDIARRLWHDSRNALSFKKHLSAIDIHGNIYLATDFVSGMIDLNRMLFKKKLSDEERRKLLFGFDQILS